MVPEEVVAGLGYPVLIIHGAEDGRIPVDHVTRIHQQAHSNSKLWVVPGADHVETLERDAVEYINRVADYLESRFGAE